MTIRIRPQTNRERMTTEFVHQCWSCLDAIDRANGGVGYPTMAEPPTELEARVLPLLVKSKLWAVIHHSGFHRFVNAGVPHVFPAHKTLGDVTRDEWEAFDARLFAGDEG
jgi:hypothetical protein